MHLHRLERIWLIFGIAMLFVFLAVLGVGTFAMGMSPNGGHQHSVDPETIEQTAPFNNLGLQQIGDNEYVATILSFAFSYSPNTLEVPVGATVHFQVSSKDVVHGFAIPGTNVNVMAIPGEISRATHTFDEPGEYLILCNEYCGIAHEMMQARILVK